MITAPSFKTLIPLTTTTVAAKLPPRARPAISLPSSSHPSSSLGSSAAFIAASILAFPEPSLAETMQKAQLFEFNLTLPIMMVQILLLMVALDKVYFTPLGKFMDDRDAMIKEKLKSVKDMSEEARQLEDEADALIMAARREMSDAMNSMKKEMSEDMQRKVAQKKAAIKEKLKEARAQMEIQKQETIKSLESHISELSEQIVKKVLPL